MPISFDTSWRFIDPLYAMLLAFGAIGTIATVTYFLAVRWKYPKQERYKRVLSLAAELLVSVGIVGLVTFAARLKIDDEIRQGERRVEQLHREVNGAIWDFARVKCLKWDGPLPPTRVVGTIFEMCNLWPKTIKASDDFVDWWGAREQLHEMAQVPGIDSKLSSTTSLAERIQVLIEADNKAGLDKHRKMLLESEDSWLFVATCALLAGIGIAFKWARAAIELKALRRGAG